MVCACPPQHITTAPNTISNSSRPSRTRAPVLATPHSSMPAADPRGDARCGVGCVWRDTQDHELARKGSNGNPHDACTMMPRPSCDQPLGQEAVISNLTLSLSLRTLSCYASERSDACGHPPRSSPSTPAKKCTPVENRSFQRYFRWSRSISAL
jgi:hypothetical protein